MNVLFFSRPLLTVALVAGLSFTAAQAQTRQTRALGSDFQQVESSGGIDIYLTQDAPAATIVEGAADVLPHIVTEVKNGTLLIRWEEGYKPWKLANKPFQAAVYITAPRLTSISLSGGADARGKTPIRADSFRIQASGGGNVWLTLQAQTLRAEASGGSDLTLSGKAQNQQVSVSGGSDYHGLALQSTTARIEASGGSDAEVWVEGQLDASASGGSDLRYKGAAKVTSEHSGGSSDIQRIK